MLSLPLEEEDGDYDADNEDDGQHGTHHPQKTLFFIHNWLGIHIRRGHRLRVRACGVHSLEGAVVLIIMHLEIIQKTLFLYISIKEKASLWFYLHFLRDPVGRAQRKHTPVHSAVGGCGSRHSSAHRRV